MSEKEFVMVEENMMMKTNEDEEETVADKEDTVELDLLFLCDSTGSMGSYIQAAQENITSIVKKISEEYNEKKASIRFGLVSYRDHPPQDTSFVTKVFDFTESFNEMKIAVNSMNASGGGDGPEAVTAALFQATKVSWRPNATKISVIIADAPPHGLEPTGDGFPNGDPDGHDPFSVVKELVEIGVVLYSVCCEPSLSSSYRFARDFFIKIAELTGGQAIALDSAQLLADVIVHGSCEELTLHKFVVDVQAEVQKQRVALGAQVSDEKVYQCATNELQSRGLRTKHMRHNGTCFYAPDTADVWKKAATEKEATTSLLATKAALLEKVSVEVSPPPKGTPCTFRGFLARGPKTVFGGSKGKKSAFAAWDEKIDDDALSCAESCHTIHQALRSAPEPASYSTNSKCEDDIISYEQVARLATRAKAKSAV